MSIDFETYRDCLMVLPCVAVEWGAGIELQIGWLKWGVIIHFG